MNRPRGLDRPITVAVQGLIRDDRSRSSSGYSITNAIVLDVVSDAVMDVVSTDASGVPTGGSDPVISADDRNAFSLNEPAAAGCGVVAAEMSIHVMHPELLQACSRALTVRCLSPA